LDYGPSGKRNCLLSVRRAIPLVPAGRNEIVEPVGVNAIEQGKEHRMSEQGPGGEHYRQLDPMPIEVIDAWGLGFNLGNALKYIARAGIKTDDPIQDLEKAQYYVTREIDRLRTWKRK
jgi:hypothetical protein